MTAFKPKGERARWKELYELLKAAGVGGTVTFAAMGEVLGLDPDSERVKIVGAFQRAAKELETVDKHAVVAVPNVGYQVAQPQQHLVLARKHQRRSARSLDRGLSKAVNVDLSKMDSNTRNAFDAVARVIGAQMDFNRRAEQRIDEHDKLLATLSERGERTESETEQVRRRLEELERRFERQQLDGV